MTVGKEYDPARSGFGAFRTGWIWTEFNEPIGLAPLLDNKNCYIQ
jgi:hypothetical protein